MEHKDSYTLQELFDSLPIPVTQLAKKADLRGATVTRILQGETARRDSINRLLLALSEVYERDLTIYNVTGFSMQRNKKLDTKEERAREKRQALEELHKRLAQ